MMNTNNLKNFPLEQHVKIIFNFIVHVQISTWKTLGFHLEERASQIHQFTV